MISKIHSIEADKKRRSTLLEHIKDGTIKITTIDTIPELTVLKFLQTKGYIVGDTIIKQHFVKGVGFADFYLPKENTLIFVDGDYWHANPNMELYKRPCYYNERQSRFAFQIRERDRQITLCAQSMGYNVVRVWENDIKKGNINL